MTLTPRAAHWRAVSSAMPQPGTTLENCTNYGTVAHKLRRGRFAALERGHDHRRQLVAASLGNRETEAIPIWAALRASTAVVFSLPTRLKTAPCAVTAMSAALRASTWAVTLRQTGPHHLHRERQHWHGGGQPVCGGVASANVGNISRPASCKSMSPPPAMRAAWPVSIRRTAYIQAASTAPENANGAVSSNSVTAANYACRNHPWRTRLGARYANRAAKSAESGLRHQRLRMCRSRADVRGQRHGGRRHGHELRHHRPRQRLESSSVSNFPAITGVGEHRRCCGVQPRGRDHPQCAAPAANANVRFSTPAVIGGLAA